MYSISPTNPHYGLFRQLCSTYDPCNSLDTLPCQTVSIDQERAFYAAASADTRHSSVSVSSIMFPMDHPASSQSSVLQQLAAETAAAHRAGTDELSLAALVLDASGLSSVSDLRVPDGLVPTVVCSRCERSGCRADVCQQPCRLCDSAHGHEQSCLRVGFTDPTITRFASTAEEGLSSLGIQAVYPSAVPAAPEVSGAAAAPALSTGDLELLQRVRPALMEFLSRARSVPCTANGTPLRIVFDELPPGERFELCRLFDRSRDPAEARIDACSSPPTRHQPVHCSGLAPASHATRAQPDSEAVPDPDPAPAPAVTSWYPPALALAHSLSDVGHSTQLPWPLQ
jgi:hypothetical protein